MSEYIWIHKSCNKSIKRSGIFGISFMQQLQNVYRSVSCCTAALYVYVHVFCSFVHNVFRLKAVIPYVHLYLPNVHLSTCHSAVMYLSGMHQPLQALCLIVYLLVYLPSCVHIISLYVCLFVCLSVALCLPISSKCYTIKNYLAVVLYTDNDVHTCISIDHTQHDIRQHSSVGPIDI